ncbi:MAG TPA: type II toxin-antitoxin system PemK/MazF family toxin [Chloroflexota bacterium]|jgi:mRNA interferase MazF|nr:type II toxin-antitoxin system PemK/MazF family toxin [Chloroflexota bacterium]
MRRGEIWLVDFEPAVGSEPNKRRPAIIISNDGASARAERLGRGLLTVVPTTSNTRRIFDFQVLLQAHDTGLDVDSKAQAEQVRGLDVSRFDRRLGRVSLTDMKRLEKALLVHLAIV